MSDRKLVFFDLETGGFDETKHAITQIGAVAVDGLTLEPTEEFEAKIKFKPESATEEALAKSSYDAEVWATDAIDPREACTRLSAFLSKHATVEMTSKRTGKPYYVAQLVAYNAAFDARFLQAWYKRLDAFMPAGYRVLCTMQRAFWYFEERPEIKPPESFQLAEVCAHFGIILDHAHDAAADNEAQLELYRKLKG